MDAGTLNCPMCGASQSVNATKCDHCGAQLATVACPSCFGMVFVGEKFCSHCGAKVQRTQVAAAVPMACPRCRLKMDAVMVGKATVRECSHCEGIWVEAADFEQICVDREQQCALLGMASSLPAPKEADVDLTVRYVSCPECYTIMNRVNFAHCSHVVVDVCAQHGTWFDKDELRKIIEFIRAGGMEKAREHELEELQDQRRQIKAEHVRTVWESDGPGIGNQLNLTSSGGSLGARIIKVLLHC